MNSDRSPLPTELQKAFNFDTAISTDLNFLFVGDSVAVQFAEAFAAATGAYSGIQVLKDSIRGGPGVIGVTPVRGGGSIGMVRMSWLFGKVYGNKPPPTEIGPEKTCVFTWIHCGIVRQDATTDS